ncbi:MAG: aminomethyl-transferring glycine dehydrogenase subunit GcvPB [Clostridia bacterium]|nr:aminomethyl-transferring glycine dehydrogenase subunit GcvPB [Clostridia bacterium]
MRTVFEISEKSCGVNFLPECDVPVCEVKTARKTELALPSVSENGLVRHYSALAKRAFGHNMGFYPLGSCTMKYNPKINEETAALEGFRSAHPLAPEYSVQGCLHAMYILQKDLCEITGMDSVTLQPAAGAHGEYTGLSLIKAYHESRGDTGRKKVIVPDSAHGTNPASAAMLGFTVVNIPSAPDGCVDLDALSAAVGDDTAALMLTNPNTVGLFDKNILKITEMVHNAGGLCYYDGANLNAVMGIARPGDMGFDVVHLNLHKSFSTPHGGGGPGSGPVGCKKKLSEFLPAGEAACENGIYCLKDANNSIGAVRSFYCNFLVAIRALTYISVLGAEGIYEAAETAVLNANYLLSKLMPEYEAPLGKRCMHEFVLSLEKLKKETGVSALDIAKSMIDRGIHPPTMYFPLIVHEALMFEPTETESRETLDEVAAVMKEILAEAKADPQAAHSAPQNAVITRPDEVAAARNPVIKI